MRRTPKTTVALSQKGQVTIPKQVRDALGLKPADRVTFELRDDVAVLRPAGRSIFEYYGSVKPRRRPERFEKVREEVSRAISEDVAREGAGG
jgi:AbrB family looped-hinge helix DNA binding protein